MTKLQKVIKYLHETDDKEPLQNPISFFLWLLKMNNLITKEESNYLDELDERQMNHTIHLVNKIRDDCE